jgi:nucleoside-diphosphate-sugar epimerase
MRLEAGESRNAPERHRKMRILVSGANGFIGSHLLKQLSRAGDYEVWGLVRKSSDLFRLDGGTYNLLRSSLTARLDPLIEGFHAVVHTAAVASDWGDRGEFYRTNVDGTVNIFEASVRCGVERFIHLSSTAVYGFGGDRNTTEEAEKHPFGNSYCTTKSIAEQKLLERSGAIKLIVLRPSNVYGPWDTKFTLPLLRGIDRGLLGFPAGGKMLTSPCYVKNLAAAVERALQTGGPFGETYNITDGLDITWREFLAVIAGEMGRRPPRISVPVKPLAALAAVLEALYRGVGAKNAPLLTRYRVAQVSRDYSFSLEKAKTKLSFTPPYSTLDGVRDSVIWYRSCVGKLRPSPQ